MKTTRRYTAIGLTAGLLGGAAAGAVLGVPGLSGASAPEALVSQTDDTTGTTDTTDATTTDETTTDATDDATTDDGDLGVGHGERIRDELQALVDDGTITAEQADAVATHLAAQRPEWPGRGGHGHGGGRGWFGGRGMASEAVAEALGIDESELRDALRDGATLAELAETNGVGIDALVDALVAEATEHLSDAVENGRLTQDEADERLAGIEERITDRLDGVDDAD